MERRKQNDARKRPNTGPSFKIPKPSYLPLDVLVGYLQPSLELVPRIEPAAEPRDAIEGVVLGKLATLSDILRNITAEIGQRHRLADRLTWRITVQYLYLKSYLLNLGLEYAEGSRPWQRRRMSLEQRLDALLQEQRREQVECWRDVAKLRAEYRKWMKQYRDVQHRARFVLDGDSSNL